MTRESWRNYQLLIRGHEPTVLAVGHELTALAVQRREKSKRNSTYNLDYYMYVDIVTIRLLTLHGYCHFHRESLGFSFMYMYINYTE